MPIKKNRRIQEISCAPKSFLPADLTMTAAAAALRVSRPALSSLQNGKAALSGDMALRIEKAFGVKMDTLMRMQSAHEIAQTCKREKLIKVQRITQAVGRRDTSRCYGRWGLRGRVRSAYRSGGRARFCGRRPRGWRLG
jgi:antitoxin HigA-1